MSTILSFPVTGTFDGNPTAFNQEIFFSDRKPASFSHSYQMIDYKSFQNAWDEHVETLGFNIFSRLKYYATNDTTYGIEDLDATITLFMSYIGVNYEYWPTNSGHQTVTNVTVNSTNIGNTANVIPGFVYTDKRVIFRSTNVSTSLNISCSSSQVLITYSIYFTPERAYDHGELIPNYVTNGTHIDGMVELSPDSYGQWWVRLSSLTSSTTSPAAYDVWFNTFTSAHPEEAESINPYDPYDDGHPADIGGGNGSYGDADVEKIDDIPVPDVPDIGAITTGLITVYNPSLTQIQALGNYLWSTSFDLDTFKKLFGDPMEAIIGLGIIPINPTSGGTKNVKVGDVDTGVAMPYLASQFAQKSMGSVTIKKEIGSFLDYTQTRVHLYLPYIGVHELPVDEVMGKTVGVTYNIDCLTGGCAAIVTVNGVVYYQYNGSCIANVPLTAINYSGAIQNAVSAAMSIGSTVAGAATGFAPLTIAGVSGIATTAANTSMHQKPAIQKSGNMGGAAGLMSVQVPYIIVSRPRRSVPKNYSKYVGNMLNVTKKLGTLTGFTMIDHIRLDSIPAMEDEKKELLSLLKQGVIF